MSRTQRRLAGFAVVLAALFAGGYAVGDQFPVDNTSDDSDGTGDHGDHGDHGDTP